MIKIGINTSRKYDVFIDKGILGDSGNIIRKIKNAKKVAIIADDITENLYGRLLKTSLENADFKTAVFKFPNGEVSKNIETYNNILNFLANEEITRDDIVIALGGGVVGDLTGFAAATYLRGIDFVQIPTTLLAAVDSSVGGKTGIDLPSGKNLAGAFHQPIAVICDTNTMDSLSEDILSDGVSEAIKSAIIGDRELFNLLKQGNSRKNIKEIIALSIRVKAKIVEEDEFENGNRRLLNLGHTFGHSIELLSGFSIKHGRAVAIGMAIASRLSEGIGLAEQNIASKIINILKINNIQYHCPFTAQEIALSAMNDKKRSDDFLNLVLPVKIGKCIIYKTPISEFSTLIEPYLN